MGANLIYEIRREGAHLPSYVEKDEILNNKYWDYVSGKFYDFLEDGSLTEQTRILLLEPEFVRSTLMKFDGLLGCFTSLSDKCVEVDEETFEVQSVDWEKSKATICVEVVLNKRILVNQPDIKKIIREHTGITNLANAKIIDNNKISVSFSKRFDTKEVA